MLQTFRAKIQIERTGKTMSAKVSLPPGSLSFVKVYNLKVEINDEEFRTKGWNSRTGAGFVVPMPVVRKLKLKNNDLIKFRIKK